jgi:hypothetical protein
VLVAEPLLLETNNYLLEATWTIWLPSPDDGRVWTVDVSVSVVFNTSKLTHKS